LTDNMGHPIAGRTISFSCCSSSTTDSNGVATSQTTQVVARNSSVGYVSWSASFAGDDTYAPSST
jgi:hypothetical protein